MSANQPANLHAKPREPFPPLWQQLSHAYAESRKEALEYYKTHGDADHRHLLRELLAEVGDCIPFPSNLVSGHEGYAIEPRLIEVAPREFELAKLIDKLQWMTRLALIKGGGSYSKKPELFASRGLTALQTGFQLDGDRDLGTTAAVLQSASCDGSTEFVENLAASLDDDMLRDLGIDADTLQLSKLCFFGLQDTEHTHTYAAVGYDDGSGFECSEVTEPGPAYWLFENLDLRRLWSVDPHQLYPASTRKDQSRHKDSQILYTVRLGSGASDSYSVPFNLGMARRTRENVTQRLGLGEDGIAKALQDGFMREKKIHDDIVDEVMRRQDVVHYAQVDRARLDDADRAKFDQGVREIERELRRKLVKADYKRGLYVERWRGLFLGENPSVTYLNEETGETLMPRVPVHYFERTERMRWAYEIWKRTRPERSALHAPDKASRPQFEIHPAVEAIESWPFFHALAPAKSLDLDDNHICVLEQEHVAHLDELETAFAACQRWVGDMCRELAEGNGLAAKIESLDLGDDVRQALLRVRGNLDGFSTVMSDLAEHLSPGSPDLQRVRNLRDHTRHASLDVDDLMKAFGNVPS
jgi:hypothetical protein